MTNVMTNLTSRQRILAYLLHHHGVSAAEISLALDVTPANSRHHLSILLADGRVKIIGDRIHQGPGRPVKIYGLGDASSGNNMAGLADALLVQFLENLPASTEMEILQALARRIVKAGPWDKNTHITRKLAMMIEELNHLGYSSRWEAHAAAPRIIFERCPYSMLIDKHPELCRMDAIILRQQLGLDVIQTACLEKTARGTLYCQFAVGR